MQSITARSGRSSSMASRVSSAISTPAAVAMTSPAWASKATRTSGFGARRKPIAGRPSRSAAPRVGPDASATTSCPRRTSAPAAPSMGGRLPPGPQVTTSARTPRANQTGPAGDGRSRPGWPAMATRASIGAVRRLYLLRHAKSSWDEAELVDHDRPLAKRGRRAAELIADHIREQAIAPDVVLCSSSRRTRETLDRIERALPEGTRVEVERALYAASAGELVERLRLLPDGVGSAMLIGHNPGLQMLAIGLAARGAELGRLRTKFPTAALATLDIPNAEWRRLGTGDAELAAYVRPRDLE